MKHISELEPNTLNEKLISELDAIWVEIKDKMRSTIPLRSTVCRFTNEIKMARIATADELEHLLFSSSLGRFMVDVELRKKDERELSPWVFDASFCVLIEGHGYVKWHNVVVDVGAAISDLDPVMTAQTYAIKNVLRMAGFKAEDDADDVFEAEAAGKAASVIQSEQSEHLSSNSEHLSSNSEDPSSCSGSADGQVQSGAQAESPSNESTPRMPSSWVTPSTVNAESIRELLLLDLKPIDYTEQLMEAIKQVRNADPVMKKMKWSELFKCCIDHQDPPTRLSGLSTNDMERLVKSLFKFERV